MATAGEGEQNDARVGCTKQDPDTFPLFEKFPQELQDMIWEQATLDYLQNASVVTYLGIIDFDIDAELPNTAGAESSDTAGAESSDTKSTDAESTDANSTDAKSPDGNPAQRFVVHNNGFRDENADWANITMDANAGLCGLRDKSTSALAQATGNARAVFKRFDPIFFIHIVRQSKLVYKLKLDMYSGDDPVVQRVRGLLNHEKVHASTAFGTAAGFRPNDTVMLSIDDIKLADVLEQVPKLFPHTRRILFNCDSAPYMGFVQHQFYHSDDDSDGDFGAEDGDTLLGEDFMYPTREAGDPMDYSFELVDTRPPVRGPTPRRRLKLDDSRFQLEEFRMRADPFVRGSTMIEFCRCTDAGITYAWPEQDFAWRLHPETATIMRNTLRRLKTHSPTIECISYVLHKQPR